MARCPHVHRAGPGVDRAGPETTVRAWRLIPCGPGAYRADTIRGPESPRPGAVGPNVRRAADMQTPGPPCGAEGQLIWFQEFERTQ